MGRYRINTSKGFFVIEANRQPTKEEALSLLEKQTNRGERSFVGNIFERPAAVSRAAIRTDPTLAAYGPFAGVAGLAGTGIRGEETKKAATMAAQFPEEVPTFEKQLSEKAGETAQKGLAKISPKKGFLSPQAPSGQALSTSAGFGARMAGSAAGMAADIATDPAGTLLAVLTAGATTPAGQKAISAAGSIPAVKTALTPVRAAGRFLTKKREIGIPGRGLIRKIKQGRAATNEIESIKQQIEDLKFKASSVKEDAAVRAKALSDKVNLEKNLMAEKLTKEINENAGRLSSETQNGLKNLFRENSKIYGQTLDDITEKLSTQQKKIINRGNVGNIIRASIDEASEALITEGIGVDTLRKLELKYTVPRNVSGKFKKADIVDLREVLADLKRAKNVIKGSGRLAPDEIPIEILRKNIGSFLEEGVGVTSISELNQSYRPVMDLTKTSNKIFKPYEGELAAGGGERFFRKALTPTKAGKETLLKSEQKLLKRMKTGEKGFAKGLGDIESASKEIISGIDKRITQLESRNIKISAAQKNIVSKAQRNLAEAMRTGAIRQRDLEILKAGGIEARKKLIGIGISSGAIVGGRKLINIILKAISGGSQ